ncbi:hypothetical protein K438DRAFT_1850278 [Mycena galopus ATCC 62051]|nr:hypothetical protein K438DRAFT_1850278 [Mycena galopus ATCC 62051]
MYGESAVVSEFPSQSATDVGAVPPEPRSPAAFFPASHHFTVAGGAFTSIGTFTGVMNNYAGDPAVPPDLRMIPLGDIDLQYEIQTNNDTGLVHRQRRRGRLFAAKIGGRQSKMTVSMYQGRKAEALLASLPKEWRQDIARYMSIRHPNIVQIHAAASSNNVHATVFHDELIPFNHFLSLYRDSPLLTAYIHEYCAASDYFGRTFGQRLAQPGCTFWMRRSTGRLCADLAPGGVMYFYWNAGVPDTPRQGIKSLDISDQEAMVINSLTLAQYHKICDWDLAKPRYIPISAPVTVTLGTVVDMSCSCDDDQVGTSLEEVAFLSDVLLQPFPDDWESSDGAEGEITDNGWTRFNADDVVNTTIWQNLRQSLHCEYWLSQANHVFSRLGITSNFENYVVVDDIEFKIRIPRTPSGHLPGFLFLCPIQDLQTGPLSFRWPACPAYWSLDPAGVESLSMEDAARLGFPDIQLSAEVSTNSWDARLYAGLRQFHQGKGFDPDSYDVARHLGHPIYQICPEANSLCVYGENGESDFPNARNVLVSVREMIDEHESTAEAVDTEYMDTPKWQEIPVPSRSFQFVMTVQLTLILFLTLLSLYNSL